MTYSCQLVTITSIAGYEGRLFGEIIVHSLAPVACITLLEPLRRYLSIRLMFKL